MITLLGDSLPTLFHLNAVDILKACSRENNGLEFADDYRHRETFRHDDSLIFKIQSDSFWQLARRYSAMR
jgi:hypothetical protein